MMPEYHHSIGSSNTTPTPSPSGVIGIHRWNSPLPYLFGGLALMLGLIALALIILACSYKKSPTDDEEQQRSSSTGNDDGGGEQKSPKLVLQPSEKLTEPRIVVIMAGDHNPSYLAKPAASVTRHTEEV